jgi:hypothetical protein
VADRLAHGQARVEAAALEHDPDALAQLALTSFGVVAEHADAAAGAPPVALEDLDRRRLASPVRAEQAEHLAARDLEGETADGVDVAIALAEVGNLDRRCAHGRAL